MSKYVTVRIERNFSKEYARWFAMVYRANKQAVRIDGQEYAANTAQISNVAWGDGSPHFRVDLKVSANVNPAVTWTRDGTEFMHYIFGWLTDDDLALLGAEVIDADEPVIVQA